MGVKLNSININYKEGDELNLVAAAAHDLKTPLVFIRTAASKLQQAEIPLNIRNQYLNRVETSAERMLNLIDSVTSAASSQQNQLPLEPLYVPDVVNQAYYDIESYAKEVGFRIKIKHSKTLPLALSHHLALRRIIYNLLDNAIKYSQDKREVSIYTRLDNQKVRIGIRDYGIGIRKSDIEQIFKLFGKVSQPNNAIAGSSGLGLYIASSLSQSMSAELSICPQPIGTSFLLRLPIAHQLSLF